MKKLRLDPESLAVEGFRADPALEEKGTVLGLDDATNNCTRHEASCLPPTGYPLCIACV
jgi:hypothetical protein